MKTILQFLLSLIIIFSLKQDSSAYMYWNLAAHANSNAYIAFENYSEINITGSITCEMFLQPDNASSGNQVLISKTDVNGNGYMVYLKLGKVTLRTNGSDVITGNTVLQNNVWTHIAVVYNAQSDSGRILINGVADASAFIPGAEPNSNSDSLVICKSKYAAPNPYQGGIDEIRVWAYPLDDFILKDNFNVSLAGVFPYLGLNVTFQKVNDAGPKALSFKGESGNEGVVGANHGLTMIDLYNSPSTSIVHNACINFDGTSYLSGPDKPDVSIVGDCTFEFWVNPATLSGQQTIIHKGPGNGTPNYAVCLYSNKVRLNVGGSFVDLGQINANVWTHVSLTLDYDYGNTKLYLNGSLAADTNVAFGVMTDDTDSLCIGGKSSGTKFTGKLDEVRISNYAKTRHDLKNQMFLSIEKSNEPDSANKNVSYCFDGCLLDNCDNGPALHSSSVIAFPDWEINFTAPVLRADTVDFSEGFHVKRNQKNIPLTGTMGETVDSLNIIASSIITQCQVYAAIEHHNIQNISIKLVAPDNTEQLLFDGTNVNHTHAIDFITTFDDSKDCTAYIGPNHVSIAPFVKPVFALNPFVSGKNTAGLWRLKVIDNVSGDASSTGRLYGWGIRFNSQSSVDNVDVSGALTGDGMYATLTEAFTAINNGTQTGANIDVTILGDTYEPSSGMTVDGGGWTRIEIKPSGTRTISGTVNPGSPLINFNGADYVTIDGLSTNGNTLAISNTTVSTSANTSTIRFINDATKNIIKNCRIEGSSNSAVGINAGNILFSTGSTTGNDSNVISNCTIAPAGSNLPSKGIYFAGTTSSQTLNNSDNVITGCKIHDYFHTGNTSSGIYSKNGTRQTTIQDNKFFQSSSRVLTTNSLHTAITIDNNNVNGVGFQIIGNTIGYADSSSNGFYEISGASNKFRAIDLNVATSIATVVQGNTIAGLKQASADGSIDASSPCMGIYIQNGLVNVINNTIGSMTSTGSIQFTSSSGSQSGFIGIGNYSSDNSVINGNSIGGITVSNSGSAAGIIYCISNNTTSTNSFTCNNNIIGGNINNSIRSTTTAATTIVNGIRYTNCSGTVTGNTIRNITADGGIGSNGSASVIGIRINAGSATTHSISQNNIHSLKNINATSAATVTGIHSQINVNAPITVERNLVHSFVMSGNNGVEHKMIGLHLQAGSGTIKNNMIRLGVDGQGNGINHGARIIGINENGTSDQIVFNSVYIGGAPTAASDTVSTYAFYSDVEVNNRTFMNNIFYNGRSNNGSNAKHYAVRISGSNPTPSGLTIGYNIYRVTGNGGILGFFNTSQRINLQAWEQTLHLDTTSFEADPRLKNPNGDLSSMDMHIDQNLPSVAEGKGINIPGVTDDFDAESRALFTPHDIGADGGNYVPPITILTLKVFIEGFYNSISNSQVGDSAVVEIRESFSPYAIHDSESVILDTNGIASIIGDGAKNVFYPVIKHRNSIETWGNPIIIKSFDSSAYDFTIAASQAYGNNQTQVDSSPLIFAMYSGDVNFDGTIDVKDLIAVYNDILNGVSGYVQTDVTGDDLPDAADLLIVYNNSNNFVSVVAP